MMPKAEAVSVGVPAVVSSYWKLALLLLPEGSVMLSTSEPPLRKKPLGLVLFRLTVVALLALTETPYWFLS